MARMPRSSDRSESELLASPDADGVLQQVHLVQDQGPAGEVVEATIMSDSDRPGTDVGVRTEHPAEVEGYVASNHPAMIMLNNWLTERGEVGNETDIAIAEIVAQVLSADSVEEVLADHKAIGMRELLNVPLRIHSAKPLRSAFELGSPWFYYVECERLDTGQRIGVTSGAQTVIAQLVRIDMLDGFPCECMPMLSKGKPTVKGYWPYKLAFPKIAVAG